MAFTEQIRKKQESAKKELNKGIEYIQSFDKKFHSKCAEIIQRQDEIKNKVSELNQHIQSTKKSIEKLKKLNKEKQQEENKIMNEFKSLEVKRVKLLKEFEESQQTCQNLQKSSEISAADKNILDLNRQKLDIYKEITNISWNYSLPINKKVAGYIRNKSTNYVRTFNFDLTELSNTEIEDRLWKEIESSENEGWCDIIEMTE